MKDDYCQENVVQPEAEHDTGLRVRVQDMCCKEYEEEAEGEEETDDCWKELDRSRCRRAGHRLKLLGRGSWSVNGLSSQCHRIVTDCGQQTVEAAKVQVLGDVDNEYALVHTSGALLMNVMNVQGNYRPVRPVYLQLARWRMATRTRARSSNGLKGFAR